MNNKIGYNWVGQLIELKQIKSIKVQDENIPDIDSSLKVWEYRRRGRAGLVSA